MKCFGKKDEKDRSKKDCCCGSHSASDHKKSKTHHGTAVKMSIRESRKLEYLKKHSMLQGRYFMLVEDW
jgi:hypothetical protein